MYNIATLNKISQVGMSRFSADYSFSDELSIANGIVVRSQDMHSMEFSDSLLAIARAGAGVNNIPLDRCAEKGIVVFNTPGANANAVKELVLAGALLASRNILDAINWGQETLTPDCEDFTKTMEKGKSQFVGHEVKRKTIGVIGLGAIGVNVANAALKFKMNVIGYDPFITLPAAHRLSNNIPVVNNLNLLLPECDFISIHVPAVASTIGMFNKELFETMKDGVIFMNFSRDKLVNEPDLLAALDSGKIKTYVTDFPTKGNINHKRVIAIPHLGASTTEAEDNCAIMAANEIMDYLEHGNIENSVNYPTCSLGKLNPNAKARVCLLHKNVPGMLGKITGLCAEQGINIIDLVNSSLNDYAYTLMDVDTDLNADTLTEQFALSPITRIRVIKNT